jgi:ABC-2 type transport system ATP-binding protein
MIPIQCHALSRVFRGVKAVDRLDLEVPVGAIYGLVGPNGAGKTTALKTMMNILRPTGGEARILGVDSRNLGPRELARIGYVSENQAIPEWMTVRYLMNYLEPFYPTWNCARATELIRRFELPADRKFAQLSRGMWMKAALAASLAWQPEVLILDEPFSGLDPLIREEVIEGILSAAGDTTILVSTHDLADIEFFATHIGFMENGRLRFSEEMTTLSEHFRHIEVTLDAVSSVSAESLPAHWLRAEISPSLVRFVDSRFDPRETKEAIRRIFPDVLNVSASPMPLRSIFLSLARPTSNSRTQS